MVRKSILIVCSLLLSQASALKIMYIGNSLTDGINYSAFHTNVEAKGEALDWARDILLGSPIMYHWNEEVAGTAGAITENNFGAAIRWANTGLAQVSFDAVTCQPYDWGSGEEAQGSYNFTNVGRTKNANIQPYVYQAWPVRSSYEANWTSTQDDAGKRSKVYNDAVFTKFSALMTTGKKPLLIPNAEVFYELLKKINAGQGSGLAFNSMFVDEVHLSGIGNYVVDCTMYAVIFKKNPSGFPTTGYSGLSAAVATLIQTTAWQVVTSNPKTGVGQVMARPASPAAPLTVAQSASQQMPLLLNGRAMALSARLSDGTLPSAAFMTIERTAGLSRTTIR